MAQPITVNKMLIVKRVWPVDDGQTWETEDVCYQHRNHMRRLENGSLVNSGPEWLQMLVMVLLGK